jgi:HK97 family phage portal protein
MINDTNKTTTWGTGIGQLIEGFYKFRLRPMLESLEQCIDRRVLTPRQRELYTAEFSLDAILRGSLKERLESGSTAVQNGLMTRNEWRQLENLPRVEGADDLTAQLNLAPLTSLGQTSGASTNAGTQATISQ